MATTSTLTQRPLTMSASGREPKKIDIATPTINDSKSENSSNSTSTPSTTTTPAVSHATARGAEVYSRFNFLSVYDWWVLGVVTTFAWACSVPSFVVPWCRRSIRRGGQHLDIGVGTGYCLTKCDLSGVKLTLSDLNPKTLATTKNRLVELGKVKEEDTKTLLHDITRPLPEGCGKFDSVSMYYLLHCMPGPTSSKTAVFAHLKHSMQPDGVISGTTILGKGVRHNLFGKIVLYFMHRNGWFDNREDGEEEFAEALREHFYFVETRIQGVVFAWRASGPRV